MSYASFIVSPINNIVSAIQKGRFNAVHRYLQKARICLPAAERSKQIFVVTFNETVNNGDLNPLLNQQGFRLCVNASCYLLGLAVHTEESDMPTTLREKSIVAAEPGVYPLISSVGKRCYLVMRRKGFEYGPAARKRELEHIHVFEQWHPFWAFLAEEL